MKVLIKSAVGSQFAASKSTGEVNDGNVQLVLGFGAKNLLAAGNFYSTLHQQYPAAAIVLCSTAGEIFDRKVMDDSITVTAIEFEKTSIKTAVINIDDYNLDSYAAGLALVKKLEITDDLCYIMVLSDGGKVNGSELVNGINEHVKYKVPVSGGLAGDGTSFNATLVGLNAEPGSGKIVAIGFYSNFSESSPWLNGWLGNVWPRKNRYQICKQRIV